MKKTILILLIGHLTLNQSICFSQEIPLICQEKKGYEINGIYSCTTQKNEKVLLQMLLCEDCTNKYFLDANTLIAECCVAMCATETSLLCKDLHDLTCDFSVNLYNKYCEKLLGPQTY